MPKQILNNDQKFVQTLVASRKQRIDPKEPDSKAFEYVVLAGSLHDYGLSVSELDSGMIDAGGDEGVDGFYIFLQGRLIQSVDEIDEHTIAKNARLDIYLFQNKYTRTVTEAVAKNFYYFSTFLDLNSTKEETFVQLNVQLREKLDLLHEIYKKLIAKYLSVNFHFFHATYSADAQNGQYEAKRNEVINKVRDFRLGKSVDVDYQVLLAKDVAENGDVTVSYSGDLTTTNSDYIRFSDSIYKSYFVTTTLSDYVKFITDKTASGVLVIRENLFDSNIRDYQSRSSINKEIEQTVINPPDNIDFWWLNNGITILADSGVDQGPALHLDNVQIVNGLQTSYSLFNAYQSSNFVDNNRQVFCKIILSDNSDVRDLIIKATNSQNAISPVSLRATDSIQRKIELVFQQKNLWYDRRKNYYRNQGKPQSAIVSINSLAQSLQTILMADPWRARTRPTSLTKADTQYKKLFNEKYSLDVYLAVARIRIKVEAILRYEYEANENIEIEIKNNFKLHILRIVSALLVGKPFPSVSEIASLKDSQLDEISLENISKAVGILSDIIEKNYSEKLNNLNNISKLQDLNSYIDRVLENKFKATINSPDI